MRILGYLLIALLFTVVARTITLSLPLDRLFEWHSSRVLARQAFLPVHSLGGAYWLYFYEHASAMFQLAVFAGVPALVFVAASALIRHSMCESTHSDLKRSAVLWLLFSLLKLHVSNRRSMGLRLLRVSLCVTAVLPLVSVAVIAPLADLSMNRVAVVDFSWLPLGLMAFSAVSSGMAFAVLFRWNQIVKFRRCSSAVACAKCGYSLAGLSASVCPECGTSREPRKLSWLERVRAGELIVARWIALIAVPSLLAAMALAPVMLPYFVCWVPR